LGYEAYVDSPGTLGKLWTPRLTETTKLAHYRAGKKPIVVYPEVVAGSPMGLGQVVRYVLNYPGLLGGDKVYAKEELVYTYQHCYYPGVERLYLPIINLRNIVDDRLEQDQRTQVAYYHNRYTKAGGKMRDFGPDALEISSTFPATNVETLAILKKAKVLYTYESSGIVLEAALCGCPVVMIPNAISLETMPQSINELGKEGIAWGEDPEEIEYAMRTVTERWPRFLKDLSLWQQELQTFIQGTQSAAEKLTLEQAWPAAIVDTLPIPDLSAQELGGRADRRKYARLNAQYTRWKELCTLREIDADIYAEHLVSGKLPQLSVVIDHRNTHINELADTLDSLAESLGEPATLFIVSEQAAPAELEGVAHIHWLETPGGDATFNLEGAGLGTDWALLVKSGTRILPQGIVEWSLAAASHAGVDLIYADDDSWSEESSGQYPNFKPDANVELLRCTNYLGNAVLVNVQSWAKASCPLSGDEIYRHALDLLARKGRSVLAHIDIVLSHIAGGLDPESENREFLAARQVLVDGGIAKRMLPHDKLGTWLVDYDARPDVRVSLVVPSGLQTGYLRSLVESLQSYPQSHLAEIIVVTAPDQVSEVEYALSDVMPAIPLVIVQLQQDSYCHSRALNTGIERASGDFILVCDDDTEILHKDWLTPLLGIALQSDVGCVAPRLMANRGPEARVVGGPMVLGINGSAASYNGEEGRLEESGIYSRLQLTQDVSTVSGHFFLMRRSDWKSLGGFNETEFGLWYAVLDYCLRLSQAGKRHVWTPLSNVLHHGGKTVGSLARDARSKFRLADSELQEKDALLLKWASVLSSDPCYNRHLSLVAPFDLESIVVIDWHPKRHDRPRVLAVPLTSGAGQYRVIEPLNALQDASLVQTCVVIPPMRGTTRPLLPLELARAAPDRLVLQHSVDDGQLGLIDKYRLVMPDLKIVQMVDDLLGDVPAKHPNRNFQTREGHQRMIQALKKSDILVVTTEPLRTHYKKYVADVRLVPNTLDKQWLGLRTIPEPREKLRVGWVGAGQHQGDLDLVVDVVRELADEVDWVFMGMQTDEIAPHLKEFHRFVQISDYPRKMASLNLDIAIAPLESNIFNECKSNLRLLEYGAMGWPVVCSDVYPYRSYDAPVIRCSDNKDEWVGALRRLIADRELRLGMGQQLHDWVNSGFLLSGVVQKWKSCLLD
jgi:glycosyltransferase involved in cell wall biosynthesis